MIDSKPSRARIGPWAAATIVAPDVEACERAYVDLLGYCVVHRAQVSPELAASWGAPAAAEAEVCILGPASGRPTYLRIVEGAVRLDADPLTSYGWAATEILVKDSRELEAQLHGSALQVVGAAAVLGYYPKIRVLRAQGPAQEVFYFTEVFGDVTEYELPQASTFVDQFFIAVLACRDIEAVQDWYRDTFGILPLALTRSHPGDRDYLDDAFGFGKRGTDESLTFATTTVPLADGCHVELDTFPPEAHEPRAAPGHLPPGSALMSAEVDSLDLVGATFLSSPVQLDAPPYDGRRAATLRGAAGELLELIERR